MLRNILRHDFEVLLLLAEKAEPTTKEFNPMYRACLVQLFTTIEADLHGLRLLDPYPTYKRGDPFPTLFKNTFTQIGETWHKEEIVEKYLEDEFPTLILIKYQRNSLTHPKKISNLITPTLSDLMTLKATFEKYTEFMRDITNGFMISSYAFEEQHISELKKQSEEIGLKLKEIVFKNTFVIHR